MLSTTAPPVRPRWTVGTARQAVGAFTLQVNLGILDGPRPRFVRRGGCDDVDGQAGDPPAVVASEMRMLVSDAERVRQGVAVDAVDSTDDRRDPGVPQLDEVAEGRRLVPAYVAQPFDDLRVRKRNPNRTERAEHRNAGCGGSKSRLVQEVAGLSVGHRHAPPVLALDRRIGKHRALREIGRLALRSVEIEAEPDRMTVQWQWSM